MNTLQIAWLAGILEGEGSFSNMRGSPTIQVSMTDRDIIERIALITDSTVRFAGKPRGKTISGEDYRLVYRCVLNGVKAIQWMMTLYSLMGERRRDSIKKTLSIWTSSPRVPRASRGQRFMAICHPDRVRTGQGLCRTCYMRQWRLGRKGFEIDPNVVSKKIAVRAPKGTRFMSTCHPERVRFGHGLCRLCYMKQYNRKRKELAASEVKP